MKDHKWVFGVVIVLLLLIGCNKEGAGCFTKAGEEKTISVDVPPYTTIDVASNVDVLLLASGPDGVEVTTGQNLLNGISLEVEEGVLKIDNLNTCFWSNGYKHPLVIIRNAGLEKVIQHGYGKIYSKDFLTADNLSLLLEDASGAIDLKVNANFIRVVSNNIGPITLTGTTQELHVGYYWCDGILYSKDLVANYCYVDHNGSNRLELNVTDKLEGQINSLGDVYLFGQQPAEEQVEVTSGGRVVEKF
mgnify:CR=1 FL=1